MTDHLAVIAELADELCDACQHTERVLYWDSNRHRKRREHRVTLPGLLAQLADLAREPGAGDSAGRPVPGSRPPVQIDALSCHTVISVAAARWAWSLRLPLRDTVESTIRSLVGAAGTLDTDTRTALAGDMRQWHIAASTLTGWRTPPWRPRVACPNHDCGRVNTLRVNLTRHTAFCTSCRIGWNPDTIGILADYVRAATAA